MLIRNGLSITAERHPGSRYHRRTLPPILYPILGGTVVQLPHPIPLFISLPLR